MNEILELYLDNRTLTELDKYDGRWITVRSQEMKKQIFMATLIRFIKLIKELKFEDIAEKQSLSNLKIKIGIQVRKNGISHLENC